MRVAVIIPCHNEVATISKVIAGSAAYGTVIVVDDASSDDSADAAFRAGAVVIRHKQNKGYDGALQSGFEKAAELGIEVAVTLDADGQHDPRILKDMLSPILSDRADVVIGIRSHVARTGETIFNLYTRLRFGVPDILCGVKAYHMQVYRGLGRFDGTGSIGTELALWALRRGLRHSTVFVQVHPRVDRPRFGSLIHANVKILRALSISVWAEIRGEQR